MLSMRKLIKKGEKLLGKKKKKYQGNLWKDVGDISFFLKGDIVKIPGGKKGRVISVKSDDVDVYVFDDTRLEMFNADVLKLETAVDGWAGNKITKGSTYTKSKYSYPMYKSCNHWMDEFDLLDGWKIYLSGKGTPSPKRTGADPTMGCYMDSGWMLGNMFWFTPNCPIDLDLFEKEKIPTLYIKWADMQGIPLREYSEAVVWCLSRIFEGEKLEIGCHGSHGRTGTLLAGILVYQGMTAEDAIKMVREKHCGKAIETKPQEDLIAKYAEELYKQNGTSEKAIETGSETADSEESAGETDAGNSDILLTATEGMGEDITGIGDKSTNS